MLRFRVCQSAEVAIVLEMMMTLYGEDLAGERMTLVKGQRTIDELYAKPEKGQIIVFERQGAIVGYAILIFFWSNEFGGNFVEVDEVFVRPLDRQTGIGTAFFGWLETAFSGKAVALSLQTPTDHAQNIQFYQQRGFAIEPNCHLWKRL